MTKKIFITPAILLIVAILVFLIVSKTSIRPKNTYKVQTFECNKGWGYEIVENEKTIIYQPYIPCIEESKAFPDEKSALNTGKLVLSKIKNQKNPSITIEELNKVLEENN